MSSGTPTAAVPLDPTLLDPVPRTLDEVRVEQIDPGFWCLRIPLPFAAPRYVNCYLLEDVDGYVLVDCGPTAGLGWDGVARALTMAGAAPDHVHTLLLTHLHSDHASLAQAVIDRLDCRLWRGRGPDSVYDRLRDPVQPLELRRGWARSEGVPDADFAVFNVPLAHDAQAIRPTPDRLLESGDVIPTCSGRWRVHPAPGHAPAQIALVEPTRGWCISADAVYEGDFTYLEYGLTPNPLQEAFTTLRHLDGLGLRRIFAGHGPPDDGPARRIAGAEAVFRAALDQHRQLLSVDVPLTGYEIACRTNGRSADPDRRGSAVSIALAMVEYLVIRGEAEAERSPDDGVRRFRRVT